MQIWRMKPDGSEQEQVTSDEFNNWFPHLSPDGRSMVFLSYEKDVTGHPENKDVTLRRMRLEQQADRRPGPPLRRPGDDQRPVLVARRAQDRVRELSDGPGAQPVRKPANVMYVSPSTEHDQYVNSKVESKPSAA